MRHLLRQISWYAVTLSNSIGERFLKTLEKIEQMVNIPVIYINRQVSQPDEKACVAGAERGGKRGEMCACYNQI